MIQVASTTPRGPFNGKAVTVVGLGRFGGGLGVTGWLCSQGARVTVSDKAPADSLADSVRALKGLDVTLHLGEHLEEDFLQADLLIVNPAVRKDMPLLAKALRAGVPYTTEINLFLERCRGTVVGVTGSVGKSTTTAMIGAILSRSMKTHVGGNIGGSLLEALPRIRKGDAVVLELSSFQLDDLPLIGISPHVAVVTNLTDNHTDWHGGMKGYIAAKKNIFRFQKPGDVLVLNADDRAVRRWAKEAPGRVEFFRGDVRGEGVPPLRVAGVPPARIAGILPARGEGILPSRPEGVSPSVASSVSSSSSSGVPFQLSLPGAHNQVNAQAAWAAAREMGATRAQATKALAAFSGLPHRLQFVAERGGVKYYNDSKCTTPEGAIVAMEGIAAGRAVIIVGGKDKGADFDELGAVLAARAKAVIALGETRDQILYAVRAHRKGKTPPLASVEDLPSAVALARRLAASGDAVLLSPACASTDMFTNYEERGNRFVKLVTGKGSRS